MEFISRFCQTITFLLVIICLLSCKNESVSSRVFDVHLHGSPEQSKQLESLRKHGVYKVALSTSWNLQQSYHSDSVKVMHGVMIPCPNGKVPYSGQSCFDNGAEWPSLAWVEELMREGKIQFLGEVLTQYQGISMSDTSIFPYYSLAEKYDVPVGIHAGSAGPDHGCPAFREDMGSPLLLENALKTFPKLRVWIMHAGVPYVDETIRMMKVYPQLYTDISVANNPEITPQQDFKNLMKRFITEGLEDRIMFGSDNADISAVLNSVLNLDVEIDQKNKILFANAEKFFAARTVQPER